MSTGSKDKGCWIQCSQCGHIYWIEEDVPIDKLYVTSVCPRCDNNVGLNCGDDENDIYVYMNENLDPRYYKY